MSTQGGTALKYAVIEAFDDLFTNIRQHIINNPFDLFH